MNHVIPHVTIPGGLASPEARRTDDRPALAASRTVLLSTWAGRTALLLAGVTVMHWIIAATTGLSDTEAYYAQWARVPALSYYDHPPLIAWTTWLFTRASSAPWAVRVGPVLYAAAFGRARLQTDGAPLLVAGRVPGGRRAVGDPRLLLHGVPAQPRGTPGASLGLVPAPLARPAGARRGLDAAGHRRRHRGGLPREVHRRPRRAGHPALSRWLGAHAALAAKALAAPGRRRGARDRDAGHRVERAPRLALVATSPVRANDAPGRREPRRCSSSRRSRAARFYSAHCSSPRCSVSWA